MNLFYTKLCKRKNTERKMILEDEFQRGPPFHTFNVSLCCRFTILAKDSKTHVEVFVELIMGGASIGWS